jgi:hypothetical protein
MLIALLIAAGALSFAATDRVAARNTLQESSIQQSPLPTPIPPTQPIPGRASPTPTLAASLPSPTPIPSIATVVVPIAPPTPTEPAGFLPAPTLTLLETPVAEVLPTRISALETPLAARRAQQKTPDPVRAQPDLSAMINTGVTAFSYLWLACGLLLLVGAAAALIWLMRRRPPGA